MRRFRLVILVCAALCVGFIGGSWLGIERRADIFSEGVKRRLSENPTIESSKTTAVTRHFDTEGEKLSAIMSAVAETEPLLRAHRLHELLGQLSSAELSELFDRTLKIGDRKQRGAILGPVLAQWEALDPLAAEEAMRPYRERLRAGKRIVSGSIDEMVIRAWAQSRPDLALAEAMAAPESNWSKWVAHAAIEVSTGNDPAKQLETLRTMPANSLRASLSQRAIESLAKKDSAAAEAQLDLLTDPKQRARVQADIITSLAERDPAAALSRLTELAPGMPPGTERLRLISFVMAQAAFKDHLAALGALDTLPGDMRTIATGAALVGWSQEHPLEALQWAENNGVDIAETKHIASFGDNGGAGWNTLISTAFNKDPEQTLAWLRQQPSSESRDRMLSECLGSGVLSGAMSERLEVYNELTPEGRIAAVGNIVWGFGRSDPAAAAEWVKTLPAGPERIAAVANLTATQINLDPARVDELTAAWPVGPERDAALRGVVNGLSRVDQLRAVEVAAQISDPAARELAYFNLARSWLYRDAPAARTWIASTSVIGAEEKRVLLRQAAER